jgi:ATP-dependent protease ClpP protease subunit
MPITNWHACRLRDPGAFQKGTFRQISRKHNGKEYRVIVGRLKGETTMTEQAYRYAMESWSAAQARSHCRSHDGTFEAGVEEDRAANAFVVSSNATAAPCGCQDDLAAIIAEGRRYHRAPVAQCVGARCAITAAHDDVELLIYDTIGSSTDARGLIEQLQGLRGRRIRVRLNSPGGDVFDGLALYNALRQHEGHVEVSIEGLAASIASVVALGGTRVTMAEASLLMIHEPHAIVIGTAHDMRDMARVLDKTTGILAQVYERKSRADHDRVRAWMHAETWFTAEEAVEAGLVDAVADRMPAEAAQIAARFDLSGFRHPPARRPIEAAPLPAPPIRPRERERTALLAEAFKYLVGSV